MAKNVDKLEEWYPDEGNHNNILTKFRQEFYKKIKIFLNKLDTYDEYQDIRNDRYTYRNDSEFKSEIKTKNKNLGYFAYNNTLGNSADNSFKII